MNWKDKAAQTIESDSIRISEKAEKRAIRIKKRKPKQNVPALDRHYRDLQALFFSSFNTAKPTGRELGNLKKMLEEYGFEDSKKMMSFVFENWEDVCRSVRINAQRPSIPILTGFRGTFFDMAKTGVVPSPMTKSEQRSQSEWDGDSAQAGAVDL